MTSVGRSRKHGRGQRSKLSRAARKLRRRLLKALRTEGLGLRRDLRFRYVRKQSKARVRAVHAHFRDERLLEEREFVGDWYPRLSKYFASGAEVDPAKVEPFPVVIGENEEHAALFRVASLWWSVPVSRGYGRRFRILIFDRSNGKLFGLLALADPVFNLRTRDEWIGWNVRTREENLAHVMDAYVLGSVPPYNRLLGAKFVSLLAASDFTREVFRKRYKGLRSLIRRRAFDGRLALVTTTSALGSSSILNRLRFEERDVFLPVGFTQGYGHFHLANGTFEAVRKYMRVCRDDEIRKYKFGSGPNYRIRVMRKTLEHLHLPAELLKHGVKRGVYVAPLAANATAFLKGEACRLRWYHRPLDKVVDFWKSRWLLPRAERDASYRDFDKELWREIVGLKKH
jgi:hypothetical protein